MSHYDDGIYADEFDMTDDEFWEAFFQTKEGGSVLDTHFNQTKDYKLLGGKEYGNDWGNS